MLWPLKAIDCYVRIKKEERMHQLVVRVLFALLALGAFQSALFADDAWVHFGPGGISYRGEKKDTPIALSDEKLVFHFAEDSYEVTVDFLFRNGGSELTIPIGFPVYFRKGDVTDPQYELKGFQTSVNGIPTPFERRTDSEERGVLAWYVKTVRFQGKGETRITVSYFSPYGRESMGTQVASYYYGSARYWHGPIGRFTIEITNDSERPLLMQRPVGEEPVPQSIAFLDTKRTRIVYKNVLATEDSSIILSLFKYSFIFYSGGLDYLGDRQATYACTIEQLRKLEYAYRAARGLIFKDAAEAQFYQNNLPDYSADSDNVESLLSSKEKDNIQSLELLQSWREKRLVLSYAELIAGRQETLFNRLRRMILPSARP